MLSSELYQHLGKTYNIVCFVDLAEIVGSKSAIFKLFDDYHKDTYDPNDRLVLYSGHYLSSELLEHVQKAASIVDISNSFILICCPYDVGSTLITIGGKYGADIPIQNSVIDIDSEELLTNDFYVADTVCPVVWSHLVITNQGNIHPCCIQTDVVGNVIDHQVIDVFYNDKMQNLRHDLLDGIQAPGCDQCWKTEKEGSILSYRQRHLNAHSKDFYTNWIDDPKILSLDLNAGNVCNFKCRICNTVKSSLHADEQLKHTNDPSRIIQIKNNTAKGKWADTELFSLQLESLLPQLTNLDLYGGEPFLLKQLPRILQTAIDLDVAKNIRLHFNSNGSIFPEKLIPLFEQFREVDIALSIDNVGKRFELERGGNWTEIEKNITEFMSLQKHNFRTYLFPTINIQNVLYVDELIDWANQTGIKATYNLLSNPWYFNIEHMTESAKQLVIDRFSNRDHLILKTIINYIQNGKGSDGTEFVRHMKKYDNIRQEDFLLTHNEIAIAMGYVLH